MTPPYTRLVSRVLFPLHEWLKGHQSPANLELLETTQWWSPEQLESFRVERLRRLLARAGTTVPYYRKLFHELGFDPGAVTAVTDLSALPFLDKVVVRANFADLVAEDAQGLVEQRTTGSTGEPFTFLISRERIAFDVAAKWRATRWWGVDIGDREVLVWGSPIEHGAQNLIRGFRDRVLRSHLLPAADLGPAEMDSYLATIARTRPRMLFGYPSMLAQLARRARERGLDMTSLGIRVAFVTAEVLQPPWREAISEVFCPVANEYGARDAGLMARECPEGGLHVTNEYLVLEILDEEGRPVVPGQPGEVVVTNLASGSFPFIRYRTGDLAAFDLRSCPCGRRLPLLKEVVGRSNDCLTAADGRLVHGSAFNYLLRALPDIQAYKIEQETLSSLRVMLIVGPAFPAGAQEQIARRYREILGPGTEVRVELVADIPREASGKFRHVVSRVGKDRAAAGSPARN